MQFSRPLKDSANSPKNKSLFEILGFDIYLQRGCDFYLHFFKSLHPRVH
jgi:hypothetical protein